MPHAWESSCVKADLFSLPLPKAEWLQSVFFIFSGFHHVWALLAECLCEGPALTIGLCVGVRVGSRAREPWSSPGITVIGFYPVLAKVKLLTQALPEALSLQVLFHLDPSMSSLSFALLTYSSFCLNWANVNKHQFVPFLQWFKKQKPQHKST